MYTQHCPYFNKDQYQDNQNQDQQAKLVYESARKGIKDSYSDVS